MFVQHGRSGIHPHAIIAFPGVDTQELLLCYDSQSDCSLSSLLLWCLLVLLCCRRRSVCRYIWRCGKGHSSAVGRIAYLCWWDSFLLVISDSSFVDYWTDTCNQTWRLHLSRSFLADYWWNEFLQVSMGTTSAWFVVSWAWLVKNLVANNKLCRPVMWLN